MVYVEFCVVWMIEVEMCLIIGRLSGAVFVIIIDIVITIIFIIIISRQPLLKTTFFRENVFCIV